MPSRSSPPAAAGASAACSTAGAAAPSTGASSRAETRPNLPARCPASTSEAGERWPQSTTGARGGGCSSASIEATYAARVGVVSSEIPSSASTATRSGRVVFRLTKNQACCPEVCPGMATVVT
eukprot:6749071-Pyramimonas_sp.AAC.1